MDYSYWGNILAGLAVACFICLFFLYKKEKTKKREITEEYTFPVIGIVLSIYYFIFILGGIINSYGYISRFTFVASALIVLFLFGYFYIFKRSNSYYRITETVLLMLMIFLLSLSTVLKNYW